MGDLMIGGPLIGRTARERACRWSSGCEGFKNGSKHLPWCDQLTDEFIAALDTMTAERDTQHELKVGYYNEAAEGWAKFKAAQAKCKRLREGLEMITGKRRCHDNLMSDKDIAVTALGESDHAD